eukprot:2955979-Alexandrium_andersonii.AAC.1
MAMPRTQQNEGLYARPAFACCYLPGCLTRAEFRWQGRRQGAALSPLDCSRARARGRVPEP